MTSDITSVGGGLGGPKRIPESECCAGGRAGRGRELEIEPLTSSLGPLGPPMRDP